MNVVLKRILIVDDERPVAKILAENLKRVSDEYFVETANSGDEALAKIRQVPYDLVLTDYRMPDMDGLTLTQAIRRVAPETQVVLMTAYGTSQLREQVKNLEIVGYLDKPFTMAQIREVVMRAVRHPQGLERDPYRTGERVVTDAVVEHLKSLQENTGAHCVLLLSMAGYPVATAGQIHDVDISSISALTVANFAASVELSRLLSNNSNFKSSYHEGPDYNLYTYAVGSDLLLAVVSGSESKAGVIWLYTKQTAAALEPLVETLPSLNRIDGEMAVAIGEEMERLFDSGDGGNGRGELLSIDEAIALGLLPAAFWDNERTEEKQLNHIGREENV